MEAHNDTNDPVVSPNVAMGQPLVGSVVWITGSWLCSSVCRIQARWGLPKIRGTLLGVPIIRTILFWGLYWGPLGKRPDGF